jgi:tetratricopeptide (TPR) repeat protein
VTEPAEKKRVPSWVWVAGVVLLGLVLRLIYVAQVGGTPLVIPDELDPGFYFEWAQRIVAGDWFGSEPFVQSPLYAYFLAFLIAILGDGVIPILVLQSLIGAGTVALTYAAGRRFFDHRRGLIAALLIALYGPFIFYEGMVMKAFLSPFLTLALMVTINRARQAAQSPSSRRAALAFVLAGATFGLLTLTRDNFILMAPFLLVLAAGLGGGWNGRGMRSMGAFAVGAALLIAPVTLRNGIVAGEFVLLTTGGGEVFYIGNNANANGLYVPPPFVRPDPRYEHADFVQRASEITGRPLTAMQSSWFWFGEGLKYIVSRPLDWLGLLWQKMMHFWNVHELPDNLDYTVMQWFSPLLDHLNFVVPPHGVATLSVPGPGGWVQTRLHLLSTFGTIAPLGLVGLFLTRRRWRHLLPLYVVLFVYVGTVMLFFNFSRFRVPIVPLLALFAADTLLALGRHLNKEWDLAVAFAGRSGDMVQRFLALRPGRSSIIAALLLIIVTLGINTVLPRGVVPAIEQAVIAGNAYYAQGNLERARQSYFTGLVLLGEGAPGPVGDELLRRHFGPGVTQDALRKELEIEAVARGDQFKAIHMGVHHGLGLALLMQGREQIARGRRQDAMPLIDRAIGQFEEVLKLAPAYLLSHRKLAEAHRLKGDSPGAIGWLTKAVDLWPDDLQARMELADILYQSGRFHEALRHLQEARLQNPDMEPQVLADFHYNRGLIQARALGYRGTALYNFERALELYPDHPRAGSIHAMIEELRAAGVRPQPEAD